MAKKEEVDTGTAVATQAPSSAMPAELLALAQQDAGKGLSKRAEDNLVPLVYVLQALSPQVQRRNAEYIEGAEAGSFWLRNAPQPICPGDLGLLVQPCYFFIDWVEWKTRDQGSGFVARHAVPAGANPDICPVPGVRRVAADPTNPNSGRVQFIRNDNGHEVVQNRNYVGRIFTRDGVLPYIIPFTSTGHTTAKAWMQLANSRGPSLWVAKYRLTTKERTNPKGTWFATDVAWDSWVTPDEYKEGRTLHDAFATGERMAEAPVEPSAPASSGGAPMDDEIPF